MIERRDVLGALLAAPCLIGATERPTPLTLYSPAPPANPMHALNQRFGEGLGSVLAPPPEVIAMALPQSVHHVAPMSDAVRGWHWPIMTTVDFLPARLGTGPEWHAYPRACPDLYFLSTLYEVGFGISVWNDEIRLPADLAGKRIAVPPRPSAVRLLAEAVLHHGWGLAGKVTLVDLPPGRVRDAAREGAVDATAWNLQVPGEAGFGGLLDAALPEGSRFLPVDPDALELIHEAYSFRSRLVSLPGLPPLLSFAQALAAWRESDAATIRAVLDHIASGAAVPGFPRSLTDMRSWPALRDDIIHPVAAAWYLERGQC